MQLLRFLELKGQSVSEFATEVHVRLGGRADDKDGLATVVTRVWRHAHGKRVPPAEDQTLYQDMTEGAVTPADWVDLALRARDPPDDDAAGKVAASG